jgi:hypothetical protein
MAQVFRSGAFLQQCWSVHPLCVSVRRITAENQLAFACTSCRFAHYVTIGSIVHGPSASEGGPQTYRNADEDRADVRAHLARCIDAHSTALSLREMDVFKDLAVIRCAECRRHYAVTVTGFETHQK